MASIESGMGQTKARRADMRPKTRKKRTNGEGNVKPGTMETWKERKDRTTQFKGNTKQQTEEEGRKLKEADKEQERHEANKAKHQGRAGKRKKARWPEGQGRKGKEKEEVKLEPQRGIS